MKTIKNQFMLVKYHISQIYMQNLIRCQSFVAYKFMVIHNARKVLSFNFVKQKFSLKLYEHKIYH